MRYTSDTSFRVRRRRRARVVVALLVLIALGVLAAAALRVGPQPAITVRPEPAVVGRSADVEVRVDEPRRGLSRVVIELEQQGRAEVIAEQRFEPLAGWRLWGERTPTWNWQLDLGSNAHPGLAEGPAILRITAEPAPAWLRSGEPAVRELAYEVKLTPPQLGVQSSQHYVAQGGCEVVIYRVGADATRDGVEAGDRFFPGWPLPGGSSGDRFALFAVPYDVADPTAVRLVAEDAAGNLRATGFVDQFFPHPPTAEEIRLDRRFLERVVPSILAGAPELRDQGDLLQNFLAINGELRRQNAATLRELAAKTKPEFLWRGAFLALPGGQVMSSFADRRTYFYEGREVDRQVHLGFDLASTARAPIPAANAGVVVLARELGIYGNTVVVDHGYGLMTLYAHLSEIAVAQGEAVRRAHVLGTTGATGLAGGDHLHFSFLLQGLPVRPVEWWDAHWIEDRLKRKLGSALPFEE
jgi:murein DD-endopeptidase MepM/ murein hydrolase activator NlpD